jgi:hypothetical protein
VGSNAVEEQTFPVDWSQLLWALYFNQVNGIICCQNQCSKNSLTTVMKLVWHDNDYVYFQESEGQFSPKEAAFCFDMTNKLVSWLTKSWIDNSNRESRDVEMVLSIHMWILLRISLQKRSIYTCIAI